ncbi:MAG: ATP-binding cassette domain-containing protein [Proteobacteria bacterium]|nr:ATP-binding cassette domain-containing protein [Pseudomonadota bacterium]
MDLTIPSFHFIRPDGTEFNFSGVATSNVQKLLITCEEIEDASIFALASFGFDIEHIKASGYILKEHDRSSHSRLKSTYTSPNPRAELSRFTTSVKEEILLGLNSHLSGSDCISQLKVVSECMGITHLLERNPLNLSGGEIARVIMAAHLALRPDVWVIDRTLGELDQLFRQEFLNVIFSTGTLSRSCVVIVDHEGILPAKQFDKIWHIDDEKNKEDSKTRPVDNQSKELDSDVLQVITNQPFNVSSFSGLRVDQLTVKRNTRLINENISLTCPKGEICWVVGANGCGKTTLFESLVNINMDWQGKIYFENQDKTDEISKFISYSPQNAEIDITEESLIKEIAFAFDLGKYDKTSLFKAKKWLNEIGLSEDLYDKSLSSNQDKKLTSVLSCIARKKPIIILDEPTLYLSTTNILIILEALKIYLETGGIALLSTHDSRLFRMAKEKFKGRSN